MLVLILLSLIALDDYKALAAKTFSFCDPKMIGDVKPGIPFCNRFFEHKLSLSMRAGKRIRIYLLFCEPQG